MSLSPTVDWITQGETRICRLGGNWRVGEAQAPDIEGVLSGAATLVFDCRDLLAWDSSLLAFVFRLRHMAEEQGCRMAPEALPEGLQRLLLLLPSLPARQAPAVLPGKDEAFLAQIGSTVTNAWRGLPATLAFVGELSLSLARLARGRARFRRADLMLFIEDAGPRALPIVSLISFLVGTILAYMGAAQLALFGAQIFIADLVGIGMVREVAALMTGILLAGRTGAAYAAQLGTMQVNEEIDAFRSFGLPVGDYLVLPRFLALLLMAPLLTLYASAVGVLAGMLVAVLVFDVGAYAYLHQTLAALHPGHFLVGLVKGTVYAALVALAGCLCGMRCGRSAQAVGEATTQAVVLGILLITVSASLLTIVFQRLGV